MPVGQRQDNILDTQSYCVRGVSCAEIKGLGLGWKNRCAVHCSEILNFIFLLLTDCVGFRTRIEQWIRGSGKLLKQTNHTETETVTLMIAAD